MLRFGVALRRYWMARSRYEEAFGLLGPALQRPEARADAGLFGAALVTAVFTARAAGSGTARRLGEQAVEVARQLGDDRLLIESLGGELRRLISSPASRRQDVRSGRRLSSAPASSPMTFCWAGA